MGRESHKRVSHYKGILPKFDLEIPRTAIGPGTIGQTTIVIRQEKEHEIEESTQGESLLSQDKIILIDTWNCT